MKIKRVNDAPAKETPHGTDVRPLYDKDTAQAVHIAFEPGQSLKPHITPVDVFFYVLEGTADIMVGDETVKVEADSLVESPKDIPHCIYNNSDKKLRVLVVKAPKPTKKTIVL